MTPLERAARALCDLDGSDSEKIVVAEARETIDMIHVATTQRWRIKLPRVRAVLTAIREPSEAMVEAGWASECVIPSQSPEGAWQAMIDAMLEEG